MDGLENNTKNIIMALNKMNGTSSLGILHCVLVTLPQKKIAEIEKDFK